MRASLYSFVCDICEYLDMCNCVCVHECICTFTFMWKICVPTCVNICVCSYVLYLLVFCLDSTPTVTWQHPGVLHPTVIWQQPGRPGPLLKGLFAPPSLFYSLILASLSFLLGFPSLHIPFPPLSMWSWLAPTSLLSLPSSASTPW